MPRIAVDLTLTPRKLVLPVNDAEGNRIAYEVVLEGYAGPRVSEKGNHDVYDLRLRVWEPLEHAGAVQFHVMTVARDPRSKTNFSARELCEATGTAFDESGFELDDCVNVPLLMYLKEDVYKGNVTTKVAALKAIPTPS